MKKPLIEAALGRPSARRPVWFLRQAGRYLPEYRDIRARHDFLTVCRTPELAAEVTLQPLRRYDLDGAIIFSDILMPPTAMGQVLTFDKEEGPVLSPPIRGSADLRSLRAVDAARDLGFVGAAISRTKAALRADQAMIGFAGAPFTVATYMIEGRGSRNFTEVKRLLFNEPTTFAELLERIAKATCDYLAMQVAAGADALMLFDTWAGQLSGPDYRDAVLPTTYRVLSAARALGVPVTYFPGQGGDKILELAGAPVDVIAVDWRTRLSQAAAHLSSIGLDVTLQGNLDPQILIADEETVRARARDVLKEGGREARAHIFNVGHGLLPHTPPDALAWVVDEVHQASN